VTNYHPRILELVNDNDDYDDRINTANHLMNRDILYIVHSKPDDNNFKDFEYRNYSEWAWKLRGNKLGPAYAHGGENTSSYFRGYMYSPEEKDRTAFEKLLLFDILSGEITVEKIDLVEFRKELQAKQDAHFNTLFSLE
jgi:hypothetical protein